MNSRKQYILEPETCFQIMKNKLHLDSIKHLSITYDFESHRELSGFLGQYFTLKVTFIDPKSTEDTQKLNFFIKLLPTRGGQLDFVKKSESFEREHGLYTKLFPKMLTSVEKSSVPECFLSIEGYALVLEDMTSKEYKMLDKFGFMELEHCLVVVKTLARFHARSFIFEETNQTTVLKFCHEENIPVNKCDSIFQSTLDFYAKNLLSIIDLMTEIDLERRERCKVKISEISSEHFEKIAPSKKYMNVLCHSDLWNNNILFKYDEHGKVDQCCFIDFQIAR